MLNNKMHGMGEFKDTTDGSLHKGMFKNGKKNGPGVNLQEDKVSKFIGHWEDDELAKHVGVLVKNLRGEYTMRNKEGRQTYPGGCVYTG